MSSLLLAVGAGRQESWGPISFVALAVGVALVVAVRVTRSRRQ